MREITATGQTVNEAVESALAQLQSTKDKCEISVLDEGKKGIFGIFGTRPAIVKVSIKLDPIEEAKAFLIDVCTKMGASTEVDIVREGKTIQFELTGEKVALLIGKRGQTLNSLQFLTQLVMNRYSDHYYNLIVDVENYRKRRNETLVQLAEKLANKAIKTRQDISLEPMPSYERKVIHTALVHNKRVKTFSTGDDSQRHIIISPIK